MKRIVVCILAVIMAACTLGCGGGSRNRKSDELVIWAGGQWIGEDAVNLQKYIDFVNENYSEQLGFKAKLEIKSSYEIDLETSMRSNDQPDLLLWDRYMTATHAYDDTFITLDSFAARDGVDLTKFNQPALNEMKYGGKVYGLPLDLDVWGLYVNTDMVDEYNVGKTDAEKLSYAPGSWTELLDMGKKLTVKRGAEIQRVGLSATDVGQRYHTFLASAATSQIGAYGKASFDTPAFNDYLSFIRTLKSYNIDRLGFDSRNTFVAKNLAIMYGSGYLGNYLSKYFDGNYLYVPQPKWDRVGSSTAGTPEAQSQNGGLLGGFGWAIPKPIEESDRGEEWDARVEMAWKFACLTATKADLNKKWVTTCGSLPAYKEQWNSEEVNSNKTLKTIASIADTSSARPSLYYFPMLDQQSIVANIVKFSNIGGTYQTYTNKQVIEIITKDTNDLIAALTV